MENNATTKAEVKITDALLTENGFLYSNPNVGKLSSLYCQEGDWRIMIDKGYAANRKEQCYTNISCWRGDGNNNKIIRRSSLSGAVDYMSELQSVIDLCEIDKTLKF